MDNETTVWIIFYQRTDIILFPRAEDIVVLLYKFEILYHYHAKGIKAYAYYHCLDYPYPSPKSFRLFSGSEQYIVYRRFSIIS